MLFDTTTTTTTTACVSECLPHALVMLRAGEGVGEGRVQEGGCVEDD